MQSTMRFFEKISPTAATLFVDGRTLFGLNTSVDITRYGPMIGKTSTNVQLKVQTNTAQILPGIKMFAFFLLIP